MLWMITAMFRHTGCVSLLLLFLLPKCVLGLLILAPEAHNPRRGNDTPIENIQVEDILDSQYNKIPLSNLERAAFPLEWYDITLDRDTLLRNRQHSNPRGQLRGRRKGQKLNIKGGDTKDGTEYSAKSPEIRTSDKTNKRRVKRDSLLKFSLNRVEVSDQHHQGFHSHFLNFQPTLSASSSFANTPESSVADTPRSSAADTPRSSVVDTSRPSAADTPRSSVVDTSRPSAADTPRSSVVDTSRPSAADTPRPSLGNTPGKSSLSIQGSNTTRMTGLQQQPEGSAPLIRDSAAGSSGRSSRFVLSGSEKSRRKRWAPNIQRIKMSQIVSASSGLGQPVILRKRNRIDAKVGVLVVVENSIYRQYLMDNGNSPRAALARIRRYYGMIFSMIDQRFQTISDPYLSVSVRISGILVAERREDSSWLEYIVDWSTVQSHGRGSVLTDRALKRFTKWISGHGDLPEFDHAMVFTAYRLTNKQSVSLGGMAYLNAICDTQSGNSVSIVADTGDFQCVKVATHELAHSLGAYHDGDRQSKTCRPDSNYVMSPLTSHQNHVLRNAFYFSPCSVRDMSYHLSKSTSSCVKNDPLVYYQYDMKRLPPGQVYNADMQCKLIFGKRSELCREGNLAAVMCGQLWCRDPNKEGSCRTNTYLTALPGTECGPSRVCYLGECITDTSKNTIQRSILSSSIRIISRVPQTKPSPFPLQEPKKPEPTKLKLKARRNKRIRRKRNRCTEDKNPKYCEVLIRVNPAGCARQAIRQYCCLTCRQDQRQQARRT